MIMSGYPAAGSGFRIAMHGSQVTGHRCSQHGIGLAHYVCSPRGYVFVDGYYDHSVSWCGVLFAPVYFNAGVSSRRGDPKSPSIVISLSVFRSLPICLHGLGTIIITSVIITHATIAMEAFSRHFPTPQVALAMTRFTLDSDGIIVKIVTGIAASNENSRIAATMKTRDLLARWPI